MVGVPLLRQRLTQQLLRNGPPQTHLHLMKLHEKNSGNE
ncbi:hypothetical protein PHET_11329 [Paragonimus heterotremus]|nr:hypothetical protein PHET_11329 [Paragonimus heterotremus]